MLCASLKMKLSYSILIVVAAFLISCGSLSSQHWRSSVRSVLDEDVPLRTANILEALGINELNANGRTTTGRCCFYLQEFELQEGLEVYEVIRLNDGSSFEFVDFRGRLLSATYYESHDGGNKRYWFYDHAGWNDFAQARLGAGDDARWAPPDSATLSPPESQAYLKLTGVLGRDEYGWICEYSTVGMAPEQREAIILLVERRSVNLIRQVLRGPNLEGRIYAADALLFLSRRGEPLSDDDRILIEDLRKSDADVRTCGNAGSYRIYLQPANDVLSDSAVARIPDMYETMAKLGYFSRYGT
jgi:hypothetical protein